MEDKFWEDLSMSFSRPVIVTYGKPKGEDAEAIWRACGFTDEERVTREVLERAVWIWAGEAHMLTEKSGRYEIAWSCRTSQGSHRVWSEWGTFVKWFAICCSDT
jgi:hypothetical protein